VEKRTLHIGAYNTAAHGWTLASCNLSDPEQKTKYIDKNGGDGAWDLSTVNTSGLPRYNTRTLTATLECSEGTRTERTALIGELVNQLDGLEWQIVHPDHPDYYLIGRVHVEVDFNRPAHSSVTLTATVEPWLYKAQETMYTLKASEEEKTAVLSNRGRKALVPVLTVTGDILLKYGTASIALTDDASYQWPVLLLTPGDHVVTFSGDGTLVVTYREAVLR